MMPRLKGLIMLDDVNRGPRGTLCNANGPCKYITKYQLDLVRFLCHYTVPVKNCFKILNVSSKSMCPLFFLPCVA